MLKALVESSLRHRGALAAAALSFFGGELLPELQEGHLIVQMSSAPGTGLEASLETGRGVTRELLARPFVESVSVQVGRAELGEDTAGPDFGELIVALEPTGDEEGAEAARFEIRKALAGFPGAKFAVLPFLEERIEETISGSRAELAVRAYGDDLDLLDRLAEEIERVLRSVPGSADVRFQRSEEPQLAVRLRRDRLGQLGFRPLEVLEAVRAAFQGERVAQVYDAGRAFDVVVVLDEALRREPERAGELWIRSRGGPLAPLRELADVYLATGRHAVLHDGARRYQEVTCNASGRDVASFAAEAKRRIASEVALPTGCYVAFAGSAEAHAQARREILVRSALAGAGVVLLLSIVFRRPRNLLLVLANVPFALVGGVLAVLLAGGVLSVGSLVGFVTLFGITTRNSIMLVSHFEHLVAREGMPWGLEAALRGASERLVPVLMTALDTGLGLLPIALGSGEAGREIEGPMAQVILGGLATSTALNLLVLPAMALKWGRFAAGPAEGRGGSG
ncbi:MAG: efflux RND transporter permease subunit [Planctomycetes bacterium]|nr:efflux RND transporter permease subunit [Planctomycetota bacterium]